MARDTQIFLGANESGNKDYTLPGNSEIAVLAVNAHFVDNGAGSDWTPAVVMISDSGHTIARAVDPSVVVTAGDDAEVSWFPGVKRGGGGAVPTVPAALVTYTPPVGDLPAGNTYLPIFRIKATVAGVFNQGGSGPNPFTIDTPGVYLLTLSVGVSNPHATEESITFAFDGAPPAVNYLSGSQNIISVVLPSTAGLSAPTFNGTLAANVRTTQNEVDMFIACSNTIHFSSAQLVVAQLSTGDMFAH